MAALTQTWVFITLCLLFLVKPVTILWKKNGEVSDRSKMNYSDANITTDFSDGEKNLFIYTYSHPLPFTGFLFCGNSTLYKFAIATVITSWGKDLYTKIYTYHAAI